MSRRSKSIRTAARGPSTFDQSVAARGSPPAQVVANAFVQQFYSILHQSPQLVCRFYKESSKLGRPNPDGVMDYVTTIQAINEKILATDYNEFKQDIGTVDAQESHDGGITVLVTGSLTGTDMVKKGFTQTFFLATQDGGYFVLNDILRVSSQGSSMTSDQLIQPVAAGSLLLAQVKAPTHSPVSEDAQLDMAIDASIQSAIAAGVPLNLNTTDVKIKRVEQPQPADSTGSSSRSTSGSCVICWDAQVVGACIPCGHMAGCMTCLDKIKRKNWGCPVCRAKVDQVVRIYAA